MCFQNSVDRPLKLIVYNVTTKKTREVQLTPSTKWPGSGLMGIKIKLTKFDKSEQVQEISSPSSSRPSSLNNDRSSRPDVAIKTSPTKQDSLRSELSEKKSPKKQTSFRAQLERHASGQLSSPKGVHSL